MVNVLDLANVIVLEYCLYGDKNRPTNLVTLLVILPNQVAAILAVIYDLKTYFFIKNHALQRQKNQQRASNSQPTEDNQQTNNCQAQNKDLENLQLLQIPFRATIISSLSAIPAILFGILTAELGFSFVTKAQSLWFLGTLIVGIRNPLVSAIIFKENESNKQLTLAANREANRQKEIFFAKQLRQELEIKRAVRKIEDHLEVQDIETSPSTEDSGDIGNVQAEIH